MDSGLLMQEVDAFQTAVMRLSGKIGSAGSLWSDARFSELSSAVRVIANMSRDVMVAGDSCRASIDKFSKISSEEY